MTLVIVNDQGSYYRGDGNRWTWNVGVAKHFSHERQVKAALNKIANKKPEDLLSIRIAYLDFTCHNEHSIERYIDKKKVAKAIFSTYSPERLAQSKQQINGLIG